jgi:hypothetical protein
VLTPRLETVESLFRKLQREQYRAFHHSNMTHKADHFLNFCTTAQSLKDYLLERLGRISNRDREPFYDTWSKSPHMRAVADIANTAKHFQLRHRRTRTPRVPETEGVRRGRTTLMKVLVNEEGAVNVVRKTNVPAYYVHLSDHTSHELYSFS